VVNSRENVFIGQFEHALDGKNRLFIPAQFRFKSRGADFIITQGLETCLYLFPTSFWKILAGRLDTLPLANKAEERAFKRMLFSAAAEAEVDAQGRILVPKSLCEYAGITRETVIVGVSNHLEIWDKTAWKKYSEDAKRIFTSVASSLPL